MHTDRSSGILLHPTSLPGPYGIGDLGPEAYRFLDFLSAAGQSLWQVLPLGPTGYADSPYQSYSAFAGNHLLISPDRLATEGLLQAEELEAAPGLPEGEVDYDAASRKKLELLRLAHARFGGGPDYERFREEHGSWLPDYAFFMALKDSQPEPVWWGWPPELRDRHHQALAAVREELVGEIALHEWLQYEFYRQWNAVRGDANRRGIRIVGDLPIFVAHNSADVWAHPELYHLDAEGQPTVVAGVPPDYFSSTGQRWGNPLYRWDVMERDGYGWWVERLRGAFALYDIVRIDHFRGFEAYWEVPAQEETAMHGRWVPGPGPKLFEKLRAALGELPIIAEDLGVITPGVEALRDDFGLPGMKVLHFAFSDPSNQYLPHNYLPNCIVYTGTHDNDTTVGWWATLSEQEKTFVRAYLGPVGEQIHWALIRLTLASVARMSVMPLQDVLGLGTAARMNMPGTTAGNWRWRLAPSLLTPEVTQRLRGLIETYGRTRPVS